LKRALAARDPARASVALPGGVVGPGTRAVALAQQRDEAGLTDALQVLDAR
jgi:hypothetical protein